MGNFYKVTKNINGRLYDYWQRTTRVGKSVKTENKYIGPASSGASFPSGQYERTVDEHQELLAAADYTPPAPEPEAYEPTYKKGDYTLNEWREILAQRRAEKKEFDTAMKIQNAKVRKAKRETKGIKALNPFIAKVLK